MVCTFVVLNYLIYIESGSFFAGDSIYLHIEVLLRKVVYILSVVGR